MFNVSSGVPSGGLTIVTITESGVEYDLELVPETDHVNLAVNYSTSLVPLSAFTTN